MKKIITIITLIICCSLIGCRPYVPDVQQGNIITQSEVKKLHYGMSKQQVRYILGDPLLADSFDDNYWTYAYTMQKRSGKIRKKYLGLYFRQNQLTTINSKPEQLQIKGPVNF